MEYSIIEQTGCYTIKIVAKEHNEMVGWAILCIITNDRHAEPYGLMENVYVEPAHRGKRIGSQLVQMVIDEAKARNCYKLIATSRHSKPAVHALYEKFGFDNWGLEFRMNMLDVEASPIKQAD